MNRLLLAPLRSIAPGAEERLMARGISTVKQWKRRENMRVTNPHPLDTGFTQG